MHKSVSSRLDKNSNQCENNFFDIIIIRGLKGKEYLNAVYENGYRAGERAASEKAAEVPDLIGLEEEMQNIRGIGGAKARAVCEVVKIFFERKVAGPDETGSEISGE